MPQTNQVLLVPGSTAGDLSEHLNHVANRAEAFTTGAVLVADLQVRTIDSALYPGTIGFEPAGGLDDVSDIVHNTVVAAQLPGGVNTASLANWTDQQGKIANLVQIADEDGNDILDGSGRKVFALAQCAAGVAQGDAIAATGLENLQLSFIAFQAGVPVQTSIGPLTFSFAMRRNMIDRNRPAYNVDPFSAGIPAGFNLEFNHIAFECTAAYTANEVIDLATGAGATNGAATRVVRGSEFDLHASAAAFIADNAIQFYLGGVRGLPVTDTTTDFLSETTIQWISATSFRINKSINVGSVFRIYRPV